MSDNREENELKNINEDNKIFMLNVSEDFDGTEEEGSSSGKLLKIVIISAVFLAVAIIAVYFIFFNNKTYRSYEVIAEYTKSLPESASYAGDYGKLICCNGEGISIYNNKGEIEWNAALSMTNPKITVSKGYAAVADIGGRNILVVNHRIVPASYVNLTMMQDILLTDISEQGEIAVLMESDGGYSIQLLNPYDKNEKLKAEIKTYSKDDGYALSLAISKDGSKLVTEYVKSEGNEIKSTLTFYNFDKIGENSNADRIVGVFPFENTIFPKLKFADNNTVCAYGDNRIACFSAKREPEMLWEKKIAGKIERIAEDESGFALLIDENNITMSESAALIDGSEKLSDYIDKNYLENGQTVNDKSVLYFFNYNGNKKFIEEVDINVKGMSVDAGEVILYSESNCIIFGNGGIEKFKTKFGDRIISFMKASGSRKYYVVSGNKLKVLKLNE